MKLSSYQQQTKTIYKVSHTFTKFLCWMMLVRNAVQKHMRTRNVVATRLKQNIKYTALLVGRLYDVRSLV